MLDIFCHHNFCHFLSMVWIRQQDVKKQTFCGKSSSSVAHFSVMTPILCYSWKH